MSIAAGVIREGLIATTRTLISMTAQSCGAAVCDGAEHFDMRPAQPRPVVLDEAIALRANDIGHLDGWPAHLVCFLRERLASCGAETASASSGFATACRWR